MLPSQNIASLFHTTQHFFPLFALYSTSLGSIYVLSTLRPIALPSTSLYTSSLISQDSLQGKLDTNLLICLNSSPHQLCQITCPNFTSPTYSQRNDTAHCDNSSPLLRQKIAHQYLSIIACLTHHNFQILVSVSTALSPITTTLSISLGSCLWPNSTIELQSFYAYC